MSILLSILLALSGMAVMALADQPDPAPSNKFSGNVTLNGADAFTGVVIDAYIDGDHRGTITVESSGKYGDFDGLEYLDVIGNASDDGKTITFTVCGAAADQSATWYEYPEPAAIVLDLTAVDDEAPAVTNATATPSSIVADGAETTQLNVTVDGCGVGNVTVNLSAIGGDDAQKMTRIGDTDVYTVTTNATEGTALGAYCLPVNASDVFGNYNDTSICIELNITTSGEDTHTISLDAGWNMVSIPVIPADASVNAIFGDNIITPVYEYNAGYMEVTSLEPTKGYWVLADSPADIEIAGTVPSDLEVTIVPGWNMIGPVSSNVQVSSFTGIITPVYGYSAGYNEVTTLEQTEGYWVLTSTETTLIV
jgi:hypothetical protein